MTPKACACRGQVVCVSADETWLEYDDRKARLGLPFFLFPGAVISRRNGAPRGSLSATKSAVLARNWWAVGLRGLIAIAFSIIVLLPRRPALGALIMMFAAYVASDGALAIVAGVRAMRRGELWQTLMLVEGATNIAVAGAVLIWPAMASVAFVHLASAWAIITGALLIAAARRLSLSHGRALLALAGVLSATWGALAAAWGLSPETSSQTLGWWLVGYALPFAAILMVLAGVLQRRNQQTYEAGK